MTPEDFNTINSKHPFLTYINFKSDDIIGIVQNSDTQLISIYVYNLLHTTAEKEKFLKLGNLWWNDSNQQLSINIFLRSDFDQFNKILKCYSRKNINNIIGHTVSIENTFQRRIKKRKIQLVRKME